MNDFLLIRRIRFGGRSRNLAAFGKRLGKPGIKTVATRGSRLVEGQIGSDIGVFWHDVAPGSGCKSADRMVSDWRLAGPLGMALNTA